MKIFLKIGLAIFAFLALTAAYVYLTKNYHGELVLVNNFEQEITSGSVEVCKKKYIFGTLKPGETYKIEFKVTSESGYKLSVQLASGELLTEEIGYVSGGIDTNATIIMKDNKFNFKLNN